MSEQVSEMKVHTHLVMPVIPAKSGPEEMPTRKFRFCASTLDKARIILWAASRARFSWSSKGMDIFATHKYASLKGICQELSYITKRDSIPNGSHFFQLVFFHNIIKQAEYCVEHVH